MTVLGGIDSVTYKKGNKMRYALWGIALIGVIFLATTFGKVLHEQVSATVPEGYRFSVSDNKWASGGLKTVYYVYDDKILVEDINLYVDDEKNVDRVVTIYDDINTVDLRYDEDGECDDGEPLSEPKILTTIKSLVSRKIGRQYIGL